jgi:hypothetical protein
VEADNTVTTRPNRTCMRVLSSVESRQFSIEHFCSNALTTIYEEKPSMCAVECNNNSLALFSMSQRLPVGQASSLSRLHDCIQTNCTRYDSSVRVISPTQRPLSDNIQRTQRTDIHAPGGIRNCNSRKRAKADPRLTPQSHWNRPSLFYIQ